jgi:hypothetical protein
LSTDRPHTANMYGFYRQKWLGMETTLGFTQALFQGTPLSTCLPVVGSSSACQWGTGRGNFDILGRDASGNIVKSGVDNGSRSDPYFQTDFNFTHQIHVSKTNEARRLVFEANIFNVLNQRAAVGYYQFAIPTNLISPSRATRFAGDPGIDWAKVMNGYDYIAEMNAEKLTFASRYGMPQIFQQARNMRLTVRFTF